MHGDPQLTFPLNLFGNRRCRQQQRCRNGGDQQALEKWHHATLALTLDIHPSERALVRHAHLVPRNTADMAS
jgi:hypothetical protein